VNRVREAVKRDLSPSEHPAMAHAENPDMAAMHHLARAIEDQNPEVARDAVKALEQIADRKALCSILKTLNTKKTKISDAILKAIEKITSGREVPVAIRIKLLKYRLNIISSNGIGN
jgi:HEAT repeat protein